MCLFLLLRSLLLLLFFLLVSFSILVADIAKSKQSNQNEIRCSKEPSIRFKNGITMHSDVDLSASCPRCLAAAAEKPNGSDGEFDSDVPAFFLSHNLFLALFLFDCFLCFSIGEPLPITLTTEEKKNTKIKAH